MYTGNKLNIIRYYIHCILLVLEFPFSLNIYYQSLFSGLENTAWLTELLGVPDIQGSTVI